MKIIPSISAPLAGVIAFTIATLSEAAGALLTEDGAPKAVIVLSESFRASDLAAKALVSHVKQMSGATLPTMNAQELRDARVENNRLVLPAGKTGAETFVLLGDGELTRRLGFSLDGVGDGGILLKTSGNMIALIGRKAELAGKRDDATASAVFHFLEALGCRVLWPGEIGKVIPQKRTIAVPDLNVRFTPPIGQRRIRFMPEGPHNFDQGLAFLGFTSTDHRAGLTAASRTEAEGAWGEWNGLGGNLGIGGGHAGGGLRGGWAQHGKTHPEWFALQPDGSRDQEGAKERWRLCVSNPGLVEHVATDILEQLDGHAKPALSLGPNDGGYSSFCMCDACKKLDAPNGPKITLRMFPHAGAKTSTNLDYVSLTDRYVHYWNAIIERVTKVVPDQLFIVDAYSYYSDPPVREKLHPNIILRYVPGSADGWKGWQAAGAKRIYWRPNNLHSGYRDGLLNVRAREIARTIRYLTENGMLATDMQGIYHNWATQGLEYYTAARLSWNPSQDYDALLDDYCRTGFGAGAESIKKYFLGAETAADDGRRRALSPLRAGADDGVTPPPAVGGYGVGRAAGKRKPSRIPVGVIDELRPLLAAAAKATEQDAPSHRRVAFLRAGFEFTALSAAAQAIGETAEQGGTVDAKAVSALMDRRWQMMRALFQNQHLAVNVALVAGHDSVLNRALGWKGPNEVTKAGKFQLQTGDDWLYEDQTGKR